MKNIKRPIIIFLIFLIFFIIIKNKNTNINSKNLFIDSDSLLSLIENNKVSIVYDYLKYRDKVYCIDNINNNQNKYYKNFIKSRFPSIKFINKFQFFLYSKLFKQKIMCYVIKIINIAHNFLFK